MSNFGDREFSLSKELVRALQYDPLLNFSEASALGS